MFLQTVSRLNNIFADKKIKIKTEICHISVSFINLYQKYKIWVFSTEAVSIFMKIFNLFFKKKEKRKIYIYNEKG